MSFDAEAAVKRSERVVDAVVFGFGLWTLCAHAAVQAGGGLDHLMIGFAVVGVAAVSVAMRPGRRAPEPSQEAEGDDAPAPAWLRTGVAALAAACAACAALGAPLAAVWALAAAAVAAATIRELATLAPAWTPAAARRADVALLVGLALVCAIITLASSRPDADDAYYLNLAVSAADDASAPLLANDSLHGEDGVPLALPVYRVHSFELLQAALARLTGRPVLDFAHLLLPALFALLVPLAWGRLARRMFPAGWAWGTAVAVGVLLFTATASHGWSSFGLVRLHQGKAVLLVVALPLVVAYALDFARTGALRAWILLAMSQIGAVGLSASALWLAPAVAAPALVAGVRTVRSSDSVRRLGLGLSASAYVLLVALLLRGATVAAFRDAAVPSPELELSSFELARQALRRVVGPDLPGLLVLFSIASAWAFAPGAVARRVSAFSAAATLVLWNPFFAGAVAAQVTSAPTYWRVLWLAPVPILVAVVLASPLSLARERPWLGVGTALALAASIFAASVVRDPRALAPSPANHVALGWPAWKVPAAEFDAARAVVLRAGSADRVLAPKRVAPWITTFHHHPAPLVVRTEYLPVLHEKLGGDELRRRVQLMRLVSGGHRPPLAVDLLRDALQPGGVKVVCLSRTVARWPDVMAVLPEQGFQKIHANADYEVWENPLW